MWRVWGIGEVYSGCWWGNLRERGNLGDPKVDGSIILRCIFRKQDVGFGLDQAGLGYGHVVGTCECANEPSGSIKLGEFLD